MLRESYNKVGMLNSYLEEPESFTLEKEECCIEGGIVILRLLSFIIKFMRDDMPVEGRQSSGEKLNFFCRTCSCLSHMVPDMSLSSRVAAAG